MSALEPLLDLRVRGRVAPYLAALGIAFAGVGIRAVLAPVLPGGYPYLAFFPSVIIATFVCGLGPGFVAALTCGLSSWFWFIEPAWQPKFDPGNLFALVYYLGVCAVEVLLIDALQQRHERLVASEARQGAMASQQVLLFKELQHRVANNLASISAMLRLERRHIERQPELAGAIIDSAEARIERMGQVHRLLYDPEAQDTPSVANIERAVAEIVDVRGAGPVEIVVDGDRTIRLETARMLPLALLVGELVTNSLKHGYDAASTGRIEIALRRMDDGHLLLSVIDDGRGMPDGAPQKPSRGGLGGAIVAGLVRQLGGRIERDGSHGMRCEVRFPES